MNNFYHTVSAFIEKNLKGKIILIFFFEYYLLLIFFIDIQSPEGLAVDWVARNIFWTDSKKLTIEVANLDTKVRKVLFKRDGIFNPRGIAVHPGKGYVYCYFILWYIN